MRHFDKFKLRYLIALLMTFSCFTACNDDIEIANLDEQSYTVPDGQLVYITDADGKLTFTTMEFRSTGFITLFLNSTNKVGSSTVQISYDMSVLEEYNSEYGNSYQPFPKELITFANDGVMTLGAKQSKSAGLNISLESNGELDFDKSYVIPLRMKVTSGDQKLAKDSETCLIFVKDLTGVPDCSKASGIKIFSCMEVNDTNPLNNLSFTLKDSGKPLIDCVILFAANINYNSEEGRVYINNNENVQALLDNREHYLKPLQDRGMKIILGILGNHDCAGIANLDDKTAQDFAQEVKAMCDVYHLDGIFVDDEYSAYQTPPPPGFVYPSSQGAARLCYEVKKAQPERWVIAYVYKSTYGLPSVIDLETGEKVESGQFIDYALHDYGGSTDLGNYFPGLPKMNMGLYSQEFARGSTATASKLSRMREDGYGSHMIFAMDPNRNNFNRVQLPAMQTIATAFYDEELVFDGKVYAKDWIK